MRQQNLVFIFGPIAVGKMSVAHALGEKLGYSHLHNHHSIELALHFYDYDTNGFKKINEGIRKLVFYTLAEDPTQRGFIFTYVWAFDEIDDWKYLENIEAVFSMHHWLTHYVELEAPQSVRLERNKSPERLRQKPSKQNLVQSQKSMLNLEERFRLNSNAGELDYERYLKIDNTDLSPTEVADLIVDAFQL